MSNYGNQIVYLCNNALCLYCIARIFRKYSKTRERNTLEIICFFLYFCILSLGYLLVGNPIISMITNLVCLFAISFLYSTSVKRNVFMVFVIYFALVAAEGLSMAILQINPKGIQNMSEGDYRAQYVLECIIILFFTYILKKSSGFKKNHEIPWYIWADVIIMQAVLMYITAMLPGNVSERYTTVFAVIIVFIDFSCLYLVDQLLKLEERRKFYTLLEEQNRSYNREIDILLDSQKRIRKMGHDIKNHFLVLKSYIEQERYQELGEYLDRMERETGTNISIIYTGHRMIDAILNYKMSIMRKEGISVDIQTKIENQLAIDDFDISVILGNMLDNAIEACREVTEEAKEIVVTFMTRKNQLFIMAKNTYNKKINWKNGVPQTSKADKEHHGIGLANMRNIIEKYDGTLEMDESGRYFMVNIMLYIR